MQRDQAHRTNELLERIAKALEKNNKLCNDCNNENQHGKVDKCVCQDDGGDGYYTTDKDGNSNKDIPGFEGTLDKLDDLYHTVPANEGRCDCGNELEGKDVICESCEDEVHHNYADDPNLEVQLNQDDPYTYDFQEGDNHTITEYNNGVINDSDHNIRTTAYYYEEAMDSVRHRDLRTKKDCIMDYVTNEFGILGARYSDITKFAYYLGAHNTYVKHNATRNRGYYAQGFNTRFGGHLVQGGKDQLVKGINNEGDERYFALSFVDQATEYWKRII